MQSNAYKILMSRTSFHPTAMQLFFTVVFISLIQTFAEAQKINGIAFSAPYEEMLHDTMFENIKVTHANWVGLVPEALLDRSSLRLLPDEENEYKGATIATIKEGIQLARKAGFQIFLKPHVILPRHDGKSKDKTRRASWRGEIQARSEEDWIILESCYEEYILELATLAEEYDVELFSIGTELKAFVQHRPDFWNNLISQIRNRYSGLITYCANWDEYEKIEFWDQLDYIGIDAYFPISKKKTPPVRKTVKKWRSIKEKIQKVSARTDRKVLFTEFGYRNVSFSGRRPWTHDRGQKQNPNDKAQANLLEALMRSFWKEDWIAGGFSWEWFGIPLEKGNTDFTVQDKPAMAVLQKYYGDAE